MKWSEICSFLLLTCSVSSLHFPSTPDMVNLLDTEANFIQTVEHFLLKVEDRIVKLKRKIESYKDDHQIASQNITEFINNPLNSYKLVKRILSEWKTVDNFLPNDLSQEMMKNMTDLKESENFPTNDDLEFAIESLERLQTTYNINISSLAEGNINGIKYPSQLSASDCFEVGQNSFMNDNFQSCFLWMTEALNRLEGETDISETSRWEILEYMAFSAFKLGNLSKALLITDELLKIYPDHPRAAGNKAYYVHKHGKDTSMPEQKLQKNDLTRIKELVGKLHKMACRREISPPISITSQLKCRYITNDIPFLRLAPIKEEEAYLNPKIVLFRDVIYDSEIEIIKNLALPELDISFVLNGTGRAFKRNERISKQTWMRDDKHPVVTTLSQRVEDITKLSVVTAEQYQVVSYGIGGFYSPHYDFYQEGDDRGVMEGYGNRIATLIFYMNDVAQGGATVFPYLQLGVWPEKGTALLWYNLLPDGQLDARTLHSGCPVLAGSKWISNKWLYERGQEFIRPCELTPSKRYLRAVVNNINKIMSTINQ